LCQAYAALLQAYANLSPQNPLYRQVEQALEYLSQLPMLKDDVPPVPAAGSVK